MPGILALTGGSGFIGGHVLRQAAAAGWRVRALARRPGALASSAAVEVIAGDLESPEALERLLAGADAVVHAAGLVAARRPAEFERINAAATGALAELAARQARPPRLLLLSSLAAREPALSPYGASKRRGEALLEAAGTGLDWAVLRPPVVYGPGDRATLPLFRQFRRGLVPHPPGGGRFSLIHVADLAAAILALLASDAMNGVTIEIDDDRPGGYDWHEVLAAASRQFGHRVRGVAVPAALMRAVAAAHVTASYLASRPVFLSQGKVSEALHRDWVCHTGRGNILSAWRPKYDLDQGFAETIAWYIAERWL
jgi:nucleoside-diphosphate-sugar epimerase